MSIECIIEITVKPRPCRRPRATPDTVRPDLTTLHTPGQQAMRIRAGEIAWRLFDARAALSVTGGYAALRRPWASSRQSSTRLGARRGVVHRPRLARRLVGRDQPALTLVSAAAGFGNSTLLTDWVADDHDRATAWLSLDAGDNDPVVFVSYVVAALRAVVSEIGATSLSLLRSSPATLQVKASNRSIERTIMANSAVKRDS